MEIRAFATFVLNVDVVADVQVQVCDLEVVGGLAYVVGAEQLGHGRTLLRCCGRLLGAYLLGRGWRRRHLASTDEREADTRISVGGFKCLDASHYF